MRCNEVVAYVTGFDVNTYPRPLFIKHSLGDLLRIYRLRTIVGYSRGERGFHIANDYVEDALKDYMSHTPLNGRRVIHLY